METFFCHVLIRFTFFRSRPQPRALLFMCELKKAEEGAYISSKALLYFVWNLYHILILPKVLEPLQKLCA